MLFDILGKALVFFANYAQNFYEKLFVFFTKARGVSASMGNLSTDSSSSTQSDDRKKDGRHLTRRATSPEPNISVNVSPERASMAMDDSVVFDLFMFNHYFHML